jgi:Tol biopolymer transport system component
MKQVFFLIASGAVLCACQKSDLNQPQRQQPPHETRNIADTLMVFSQNQQNNKSNILAKYFNTGQVKLIAYNGTAPYATNQRLVYIKNGNTLGFGRLDGISKLLIQLNEPSYPSLSVDSRLICAVDHDAEAYHLLVFDTLGNKNVLLETINEITSPVFTEDGTKIAFAEKTTTNSSSIFIIPVTGGTTLQLTSAVPDVYDQYCAVVGDNVFFARTRAIAGSASAEIFAVNINSSGEIQKTNYTSNWSTASFFIKNLRRVNGSTLIFCSNHSNTNCDLFLYRIDGIETVVRMTETDEEESFPNMIPDYGRS